MDNLVFCLNATIPIFLLMVLGYIFKRIKILSPEVTKGLNSFVFKVSLPVLVFKDLATEDIRQLWDGEFVLYCFGVTVVSIAIVFGISLLFKDRNSQAEFIQCSYRSSAALLGVGIIQNIYGNAGAASLMIIGAVPLYNIFAVIILSILKSDNTKGTLDKKTVLNTLKGIVTNPIIIGIVVGIVFSLIKLPLPTIVDKTVGYVAATATPLGLIALGASFDIKAALQKAGSSIVATIIKLVVFCAIFIPISILLGYRNEKLIALLIMLGSPTTVSSFVMAKSMGHDGTTSASVVMLTTFFSAFTLTLWLFILKNMGVI